MGEFLALEHGTEFDGYTIRSDRTSTDASEIEVLGVATPMMDVVATQTL